MPLKREHLSYVDTVLGGGMKGSLKLTGFLASWSLQFGCFVSDSLNSPKHTIGGFDLSFGAH